MSAALAIGAGIMFAKAPAASIFLARAPQALTGAVSSTRTAFAQLGFAVGLASSSSMLYGFFDTRYRHALEAAGFSEKLQMQAYQIVERFANTGTTHGLDALLVQRVLAEAKTTYFTAYATTMFAAAAFIGLIAAATLLLRAPAGPSARVG
ncbi:MAG TPA: hypothetical protein VMH02_12190 [Verrucomicrobiae bacterium]|nr:hypothetical protein [Verrucomicrobiae bacterium]